MTSASTRTCRARIACVRAKQALWARGDAACELSAALAQVPATAADFYIWLLQPGRIAAPKCCRGAPAPVLGFSPGRLLSSAAGLRAGVGVLRSPPGDSSRHVALQIWTLFACGLHVFTAALWAANIWPCSYVSM